LADAKTVSYASKVLMLRIRGVDYFATKRLAKTETRHGQKTKKMTTEPFPIQLVTIWWIPSKVLHVG
jgi:hypothetical protein